jgi:hypothetical protein
MDLITEYLKAIVNGLKTKMDILRYDGAWHTLNIGTPIHAMHTITGENIIGTESKTGQ